MGKVFSSLVVRPIKNFNVESKAHKIVDKNVKPKVAPKHDSTKDQIDSYIKANGKTFRSEIKEKNEELGNMLKGMVVEVNKFGQVDNKDYGKKLPQSRVKSSVPEYGYVEPDVVKEGHVSLKQALELIGKHWADQENYKAEDIARDYKIATDDAEKIIKYFSMFHLQIPKKPQPEPDSDIKLSKTTDNIHLKDISRILIDKK